MEKIIRLAEAELNEKVSQLDSWKTNLAEAIDAVVEAKEGINKAEAEVNACASQIERLYEKFPEVLSPREKSYGSDFAKAASPNQAKTCKPYSESSRRFTLNDLENALAEATGQEAKSLLLKMSFKAIEEIPTSAIKEFIDTFNFMV